MASEEELALRRRRAKAKLAIMQAQPSEAPIEEDPSFLSQVRHVAGGVPQAGFDILDAPYNIRKMLESGASAITGSEVDLSLPEAFNYFAPTSLINTKFSERPGISQAEEFLTKETVTGDQSPLTDALRTGVEWGASGPINAVRKAAVRPDLYMGAGAAIGDYISNNISPDSAAGELIGGGSGLLASIIRRDPSKMSGPVEKARKFIERNTENVDETIEALGRASKSDEIGTLADITGDRGIYNVEAGASRDPRFGGVVDDLDAARQRQIAEEVRRPFGDTDPSTAQITAKEAIDSARRRVDARTGRLQSTAADDAAARAAGVEKSRIANTGRLDQASLASARAAEDAATAQARATESALPLATGKRPAQASAEAQEAVQAAREPFKQKANELWETFKAQPKVDTIAARTAGDDIFKSLTPGIKEAIKDTYGKQIRQIGRWENEVAGADIQNWIRDTQAKLTRRRDSGKWSDSDEAMKRILTEVEDGLSGSNQYFSAAREATKELYDRFGRGQAGKALSSSEPEQYIGKAGGLTDESGAVLARRLLEEAQTPELVPRVVESLKAAGQRYGVDERFMAQYGDVLDALPPQVRNQFQKSIDADLAVDVAQKAETAAEKSALKATTDAFRESERLGRQESKIASDLGTARSRASKGGRRLKKTINQTNLAKYGQSPDATITSLLKPDKGDQLGSLYRSLANRGEGEAFKAAVGNKLSNVLATGSDLSTKVSPSARGKFDKMKQSILDSKILTADEVADIERSLAKTESVTFRGKSWAEVANKLDNEFQDNLLPSLAAAASLKVLPGSSLILAGAVRRAFKRFLPKVLRGGENTQEIQALEYFLANPDKYYDAAIGAKTAEEAAQNILSKVIGATQAAEIMAGE